MHTAVMTVMTVEIVPTGSPMTKAEIAVKGHSHYAAVEEREKSASTAVNRAKAHRSAREMVSTLPNRKLLSSGTYPGVKHKQDAHRHAYCPDDGYGRVLAHPASDRHQLPPSDEATANSAAVSTGFHPK